MLPWINIWTGIQSHWGGCLPCRRYRVQVKVASRWGPWELVRGIVLGSLFTGSAEINKRLWFLLRVALNVPWYMVILRIFWLPQHHRWLLTTMIMVRKVSLTLQTGLSLPQNTRFLSLQYREHIGHWYSTWSNSANLYRELCPRLELSNRCWGKCHWEQVRLSLPQRIVTVKQHKLPGGSLRK